MRLAADRVYWKTGNVSGIDFIDRLAKVSRTIAIGASVIVALVAAWVIRDARLRRQRVA
jgi:hypothetical protein